MSNKKRVLVLGSTGAMWQYLVPELAKTDYLVDAVSLDDETPYNGNVKCTRANAKGKAFLEPLLRENNSPGRHRRLHLCSSRKHRARQEMLKKHE